MGRRGWRSLLAYAAAGFAAVLTVASVAFGIWTTVTSNTALFGRQSSLSGTYSFVLSAVLASGGVLAWAQRRGRSGVTRPREGTWRMVPVRSCSAGDVRVHPAAAPVEIMPPYVRRDHDEVLRERLRSAGRQGGFVLLIGGSSTGKSRSLLEAIVDVLDGWQILLPESPAAVKQASATGKIRPRTVIWLDDTPAERYIIAAEDGLTGHDLRNIMSYSRPVVVVDSLWPSRYLTLMAEPWQSDDLLPEDPSRDARDALALAGDPVLVAEQFSPGERQRAQSLAAVDERIAVALSDSHFGVTQTLAGAPALIRRYHNAESASPVAYAVMSAAIDARRLGYSAPLTEAFLRMASPGYLTRRQRAVLADGNPGASVGWFDHALAYATADSNPGHVAPLIAEPGDGLNSDPLGYSVADYLLQYVQEERRHISVPGTTWEALLAFSHVQADLARWLFQDDRIGELRQLADSGDNRARELLVNWLFQDDRIGELRQLADSGDNRARELLVNWLFQDDRIGELRQRADAGDDDARQKLAAWHYERNRLDEAMVAIRPLADAGNDHARELLAGWLSEQHRLDEAIVAIRPLADAGNDHARELLAGWLSEQHRLDEAIVAIRPLADAGNDHARQLLARWLYQGDLIDELRRRADSGDDHARRLLAGWLSEHDGVDELRERASAGDDTARQGLAIRLYESGRLSEAVVAIRPLADAGNDHARQLLAGWLYQGDLIDELRRRADSGDDHARRLLAGWLSEHDGVDELRRRADSGDDHARRLLAGWLSEHDGVDELRERASAGDDTARQGLAIRLYESGRLSEAVVAIRPLADAGNDHARQLLAGWLYQGDLIDELRRRADSGDDHARRLLAGWLSEHDRIDELRRRADSGDDHARRLLAGWLSEHDGVDELRERASAGDDTARQGLAIRLYESGRLSEAVVAIRPLADAGNDHARQLLARWLYQGDRTERLRQRAGAEGAEATAVSEEAAAAGDDYSVRSKPAGQPGSAPAPAARPGGPVREPAAGDGDQPSKERGADRS